MARLPFTSLALVLVASTVHAGEARYELWKSEGPARWDLARDVARLYIDLEERGLLETREVVDPEGRPVIQILQDEKLWFSGSPLLGRHRNVVNLHHLGFGTGEFRDVNRAVRMAEILPLIEVASHCSGGNP